MANELASNAIRHSASGRGGQLAVEVTWRGNVVRVAVADSGGPAEPHVIDDPASEHGWGLLLVRGLSARTGVCGDHRGRLIWPDVLCEDPGTETATDRPDGYEAAIRDGQAGLARRFTGVPAWFGRATLEWVGASRPGRAGDRADGSGTGRATVPAAGHPDPAAGRRHAGPPGRC